MFNIKKHNNDLYNTLISLSRNIFFYKTIKLPDIFETRIYLIFIHFSIMMIVFKNKGQKFEQKKYDSLFHNIEFNLRELGFGDVSVNKKMKEFNRILYDILLKINKSKMTNKDELKVNDKLILKYFPELDDQKSPKYKHFEKYLTNFYKFCFEIPLQNMVREAVNYKG